MSRALALLFGFLVVAAVFILDRLIERYDLFSLKKFFQHTRGCGQDPRGKGTFEGLRFKL